MNILVTGAKGFLGRNLVHELKNCGYNDISEFDVDTDPSLLKKYVKKAEFIYHLAGVNRPVADGDFMAGNYGFTQNLLDLLVQNSNGCPIVLASSIQAVMSNPYGESKKASENAVINHSKRLGAKVLVYRFPNVFGKWCKPNYNSVVATYCHNIARDIPIVIKNPKTVLQLVYIDDVVKELVMALKGKENRIGDFCEVPIVYDISLEKLAEILYSFKKSREDLIIPNMGNELTKKMYSTYLSYLPAESFNYELKSVKDERGTFTEFLKTPERGQVSINITKPGIVKGNHWHHTKVEKFLVVSGRGVIRFRQIDSNDILEYFVSDQKLELVDIPPGYTHSIENLGNQDLVTIIWANEIFNPNNQDKYYKEV